MDLVVVLLLQLIIIVDYLNNLSILDLNIIPLLLFERLELVF